MMVAGSILAVRGANSLFIPHDVEAWVMPGVSQLVNPLEKEQASSTPLLNIQKYEIPIILTRGSHILYTSIM